MKTVLGLFLLVVMSHASASETWGVINTKSTHFNGEHLDLNENNFGLGVEHYYTNNKGIAVGAFRNSFYKTSTYFAGTIRTNPIRNFRLNLSGGMINGYEMVKEDGGFFPAIFPSISYEMNHFGGNLVLYPPHPKDPNTLFALGLQIKFKF